MNKNEEIVRGKIALEDLDGFGKILQEDDPPGTAFSKEELNEFYSYHFDKSLADAVERGEPFESWFSKAVKDLKVPNNGDRVREKWLGFYNEVKKIAEE